MLRYLMPLLDRIVRRFDRWVLALEAARPAGPEIGPIDDDGSFCTGVPGGEVAEERVFISPPLVDPGYNPQTGQWVQAGRAGLGWTPCCEGTGYADYAAVPCPAPGCPAVAREMHLSKAQTESTNLDLYRAPLASLAEAVARDQVSLTDTTRKVINE